MIKYFGGTEEDCLSFSAVLLRNSIAFSLDCLSPFLNMVPSEYEPKPH